MADANVMAEERASDTSDNSQLATFRIGDELFGLGISNIREIVRYPEITSVPRSPAYLSGLANMRGSVLPVIDARIRLGVAVHALTDATRVLVIEHGGAATGMIVDAVCGVISLERAERELPPPLLGATGSGTVDTRYVKSVIKADHGRKIIMEIDADALCLTELARGAAAHADGGVSTGARDQNVAACLSEIQLVTFLVAREEYAFPIASVREVLRIGKITEVPDVASYLLGILSIRNALLPVVDIRKLFGLPGLVEDLSRELDEVEHFARHLYATFEQYLTKGALWTPDARVNAVWQWFDSLHTSSEILGRQFQLLRILCQKAYGVMTSVRREKGRLPEEDIARTLEEIRAFVEQISLRVQECKSVLSREIQEDQRILVIEIGRMPVGILVDRMQQVIRLPEHIIEQPPVLLSSERASTLKGIVKLDKGARLVMLVDQDQMLRCEDLAGLGNGEYVSGGDVLPEEPQLDTIGEFLQLVTFKLGDEEFGLSIEDVQEINRLDDITSVPRAPAFVEGVMNLRGNVTPAIDLRKRFGLPQVEHDESTRVIIVNLNGNLTGFIVDSVSEVFRLEKTAIDTPPEVIRTDMNMDFMKGICKDNHDSNKMIVLIDVSKILATHEQEQLAASLAAVKKKTESAPVKKAPPVPVTPSAPVQAEPLVVEEPAPATPVFEAAEEPVRASEPATEPMKEDTPAPVQEVAAPPAVEQTPPQEEPAAVEIPVTAPRKRLKRA